MGKIEIEYNDVRLTRIHVVGNSYHYYVNGIPVKYWSLEVVNDKESKLVIIK